MTSTDKTSPCTQGALPKPTSPEQAFSATDLAEPPHQGHAVITVVDYGPQYQHAFKTLNVEWISQQWQLEAPDYHALDNPDTYILAPGGAILMVLADDKPIGCCALIKMDDWSFELAKMAVQPAYQGQGIGYLLGQRIIARAKSMGAKRLYLESNTVLTPAMKLYQKLGFQPVVGKVSPYARSNIQMALVFP